MGSSLPSPFNTKYPALPADAALRIVRTLSINCPCLAESQIRDCVDLGSGPKEQRQHVQTRQVRPLLDSLVTADYLGVHDISFVARPTISSEPLFADDGFYFDPPQCTEDDFARLAAVTQSRVRDLAEHGKKRIYYATVEAAELIRSHGLFAPFPESRLPESQEQRIELVNRLVASHPRAVKEPPGGAGGSKRPLTEPPEKRETPPSPHELSRSDLTAVINLGQLLFLDAFKEKVQSRECVYSVTATTHEDQRVYGRMERKDGSGTFIALFFLGSLFPHQLRERMLEHSFEFDPWPSRLWWM